MSNARQETVATIAAPKSGVRGVEMSRLRALCEGHYSWAQSNFGLRYLEDCDLNKKRNRAPYDASLFPQKQLRPSADLDNYLLDNYLNYW